MTLLACAILLPGLAFAGSPPKPITDAQRADIMREIKLGMQASRELENARAKEKTLKGRPEHFQGLEGIGGVGWVEPQNS